MFALVLGFHSSVRICQQPLTMPVSKKTNIPKRLAFRVVRTASGPNTERVIGWRTLSVPLQVPCEQRVICLCRIRCLREAEAQHIRTQAHGTVCPRTVVRRIKRCQHVQRGLDRRLPMKAQRDIDLLSDPRPGRCPSEAGDGRRRGSLAAQKGPRADRMLARIEPLQWDVELLEQAEDYGCCEQVVVGSIFISVKPGDQSLEAALIEMVGDVGVK